MVSTIVYYKNGRRVHIGKTVDETAKSMVGPFTVEMIAARIAQQGEKIEIESISRVLYNRSCIKDGPARRLERNVYEWIR